MTTVPAGIVVPSPSATPVDCAVLADDLPDLDAEPHVHAVTRVEVREQSRHLRTEDTQQRQLAHLQHSHVETGAAGGRGGLQADPPRADDRHRRATSERGTKSVAVADSAQVVNPFEVSAGDVEVSRRRAGGEQKFVVVQSFATLEHDLVVGSIDGRGARAETQVHVVVRVPLPLMDEQSVEIGGPL